MRFRGPKGELPKGKDGSYATSLPLWKCMWEGSDVIVAWKQNGRLLDPDHGFPVCCFLLKLPFGRGSKILLLRHTKAHYKGSY